MTGPAAYSSPRRSPKAPFGFLANGKPRVRPYRRRLANHVPGAEEYLARVPGHPAPYDFTEAAVLVGADFCRRLASAWSAAFTADQPVYTEKRRHCMFLFLRYVAEAAVDRPEGPEAMLLDGLVEGDVEPVSYADATAAFCARLHDRGDSSIVASDNKRTRNNNINGLGATLGELGRWGLLPVDHGMTAIKTGPLEPRTLTVAEVSADGELDNSDPRAAFAALLRNPVLTERLGIRPDSTSVLNADELAEAMVKIIQLRLEALRDCAVADLEAEAMVRNEGLALLDRSDLPDSGDFMEALKGWRPEAGIDKLLERLEVPPWTTLPGSPEKRLLGLVVRAIAPHYAGLFKVSKLDWKLAAAMRACGGLEEVTRHFEGTMPAKTAAHLIVLIDTIFNVSVCDRLAANPFAGSVFRGKVEILTVEAIKLRAGGKVVHGKLVVEEGETGEDVESCFLDVKRVDKRRSGVWAIKTWLELSEPFRRIAEQEGGDLHLYLWILPEGGMRYRGRIRRPHFTSDHAAWNEFLKKHVDDPVIGGLPITREMIRISCLQARSGPTDESGLVMRRIAQHGSLDTTHSYGRTSWMAAVLTQHIRKFQNLLEATAGSEIEDMARILGLSPETVLERRSLALQTGLGFFCMDPLAGERPGTTVGEPCDRLEDCPACRLRRFVPNPEALEALWLFHKALRDARESWEAIREDRWTAIWLPWLAIVMATENMLNSGRFKGRYERAAAVAAGRLASGDVSLPVLW